ncbi:Ig lambda chain V-I region BL2 [Tupaia chinensis]|uniref:Ig lambda chain V-I region BL2 n=1 Tax=Tupaia chinensis TaxID=246437 RepID=L9KS86_TUPCH|nr:Ig lambda chain V-I region BL2 [Tupaia chinensis]
MTWAPLLLTFLTHCTVLCVLLHHLDVTHTRLTQLPSVSQNLRHTAALTCTGDSNNVGNEGSTWLQQHPGRVLKVLTHRKNYQPQGSQRGSLAPGDLPSSRQLGLNFSFDRASGSTFGHLEEHTCYLTKHSLRHLQATPSGNLQTHTLLRSSRMTQSQGSHLPVQLHRLEIQTFLFQPAGTPIRPTASHPG